MNGTGETLREPTLTIHKNVCSLDVAMDDTLRVQVN